MSNVNNNVECYPKDAVQRTIALRSSRGYNAVTHVTLLHCSSIPYQHLPYVLEKLRDVILFILYKKKKKKKMFENQAAWGYGVQEHYINITCITHITNNVVSIPLIDILSSSDIILP